jgi:Adhesin P1 N-terminal domain
MVLPGDFYKNLVRRDDMSLKPLFSFLFILALLSACSSADEEKANQDQSGKENGEESSENIDVDKGLLNVEITLPASFFEDEADLESTKADAEKEGIKVTKNDDGSLTYKMSKAKHKEMVQEMETEMVASIDEMKNSEDFTSIQDITYNDSFSEYTMIVDKETYENSFDSFAVFGLGLSGMYYQLFNGVNPEDYKVKIMVQDADTKEVISEVIYPDDLEESEGEGQESEEQGHAGTHTGG